MKMRDRILAGTVCLALLSLPAFAQKTSPAFEVADVHPSPARLNPAMRGGLAKGERFQLRDATLEDLIVSAYAVDPASIFGGPQWIAFDRFDVLAKAPPATSQEDARLMLRSLLAERFKLVAHTDTRPLPAFALSAGPHPKLKQAVGSAAPGGCEFQPPAKDAPAMGGMNIHFACHNETMKEFADFLHEVASPYLRKPVVDTTGLKGGWDFDVQWTYQIPKDADGVTIFTAVDKQLGLKLEQKTAPLPVVVVESALETPTPNVPDIAKLLPPAPRAQFDVAIIRPSSPDEKYFTINWDPSGKVTLQHATLLTLIYKSFDTAPGKIVDKPKWLEADLWDITGKASAEGTSPIPGVGQQFDFDDIKEMLRSLLADRFKLVTHTEDRPAEVFALIATNPKMKKGDPAVHPSCKEGPGPDGKDPRMENPLVTRLYYCQNMTMTQFTTELSTIASGYLPAPLINATGLDGGYDFTISYSKASDLKKSVSGGSNGDTPNASDPSTGISLFDAVQKQLGLKLEKRDKVPVPTLVIDHLEQKPTEN